MIRNLVMALLPYLFTAASGTLVASLVAAIGFLASNSAYRAYALRAARAGVISLAVTAVTASMYVVIDVHWR